MEKYSYNIEIKWQKNILRFSFPFQKNSMSTELHSGSICGYIIKTYKKQTYKFKQK